MRSRGGGWGTGPRLLAALVLAALLLAAALYAPRAHAQGCAQCLDTTAATSPATQRAYRRAILMMGGAAGGFFVATLALFKRNR